MSRPDDYRGRIGAPRGGLRDYDEVDREDRRYSSTIQPARSRIREPVKEPPRRKEGGKDPHVLRILSKVYDHCIVKDYVLRDGQVHEYENFFEFIKKLLESVNTSLSTKLIKGSYEVKKISIITSETTSDEQKRLTNQLRHAHQAKHCQVVVMGLPKSIFVGNGFGTERTAMYSAAKDLADKMHRIGFITQNLYEVISSDRHFDTKRKLPDFTKTIDCFIAFERQIISPRGDLIAGWPRDLLDALDQPPQVFDKLSDVFKKISRDVHGDGGLSSSRSKSSAPADEDIERKIAKQREELLRRERAREMIEPLEDVVPLGYAPMAPMLPGMPYAAAMRTAYGMSMMTPGMPGLMPQMLVPPVGIVNPISRGSTRDNTRAVDMEIEEQHPYRRKNSPSRRSRRDESMERRARDREEDRRRRDEAERLKRKEEELERKIREEELRKQDIEAEVRRRLDEELAKRNVLPPVVPTSRHFLESINLATKPPTSSSYDHEMREIRQLVNETQSRLQQINESDCDTGISATTLRTLASLGDRACDMDAVQRAELIVELRAILGHGQTPQPDGWHHGQPSRQIITPSNNAYYERSRDHRESKKRSRSPRSRSRSPRSARGRNRYETSSSRSRREEEDLVQRRTSGSGINAQDCAFCSSFYHTADLCHLHTSSSARKQELKKMGRCQGCLKKHGGSCMDASRCDYCGLYGHHRAICDHPEHIRKLAALRELAKPR